MNDIPLISVIVPVYNAKDYLQKCINSILAQTYKNLELIIVNDGSSDSSAELCNRYLSYSNVKVIHQTNQGVAAARNAGLSLMTGEYVAFVDSDDWIDPNYIEEQYNCVISKNADMCISLAVAEDCDGNGIAISKDTNVPPDNCVSKHQMYCLFVKDFLPKYVTPWTKLYRKKLFENFRFPVGFHFEDESCHRLYQKCDKIAFLNKSLYHYLIRSGSLCHSSTSIYDCDAIELHLDRVRMFLEENEPELAGITLADLTRKLVYLNAVLRDKPSQKRIKELYEAARKEFEQNHLSELALLTRFRLWIDIHAFSFCTLIVYLKTMLLSWRNR